MSQETQELHNECVTVTVTKQPGCQIFLEVHLKPEATQQAYQDAVKDLRREISIPGFRKGKVPRELVIENYKKPLEQHWKELILQRGFQESLRLAQWEPLSKETIKPAKMLRFSEEEGAIFTLQYESWPKAPRIDIKDIHLKSVQPEEISQDRLDKRLADLRVFSAEWKEIFDRPANYGDYVKIDLDVVESPAHNICINYFLHLDTKNTPEWLVDLALGLNINESKDGFSQNILTPSTIENSSQNYLTDSPLQKALNQAQNEQNELHHLLAPLSEKKMQVRLTLKAIQEAHLPDLNDEFAQKMGMESYPQLVERIQEILIKQSKLVCQEVLRRQLRTFLMDKYPFDLPASLVEQEVSMRVSILQSLQKEHKAPSHLNLNSRDLRLLVEKQVKEFLVYVFLLKPIAQYANPQISADELLQELVSHMMMPKYDEFFISPQMDKDTAYERVSMKLMTEKCEDFLISQAHFDN